ncbi:MAG: ACP S-malonyltransferase [Pseudomonadota bacterium]|nr:ACP S-malonyltransferase [Pseudomonadota bacterium]
MRILAMFPGQGSQHPGMGKELLDDFPYCQAVFEEIEDTTHLRIRHLCLHADADTLTQTINTQPCIFAVSIAYHTVLKRECGYQPTVFAGHSLGELTALVASDKLSLASASKLVQLRATAMQKAVGTGIMLAVLGADLAAIKQATAATDTDIANLNSPKQTVLAGSPTGIAQAKELLLASNKCKCLPVPVSAPFHSRLMLAAEEEMQTPILACKLNANANTVISNYRGLVEPYQLHYLVKQISHPVQWTQTIDSAIAANCDVTLEVGTKSVLTSLLRSFPHWQGKSYAKHSQLQEFIRLTS